MKQEFENILIVAGSGRNAGKTTFLCRLIEANKNSKITAIKITPHFHTPTVGLNLLFDASHFRIYEEANHNTNKDSSRYLQAGALRSIVINSNDEYLKEAFFKALDLLDDSPIVIESASLANVIKPSFFLFIQKEDEATKESANKIIPLTDKIILSTGSEFKIQPETILFDRNWKIKNHDYAGTGS